MTSDELWREYLALCDLAEAAAEYDTMASSQWAARLEAARDEAIKADQIEQMDKRRVLGMDVSADLVDSVLEHGGL
jgi:hypothetical protein